ncbi:MAG: methyltransferase domain-containing protein [Chloroflexi bacterium]|nr:MAG: methyltransferase domain-containing protein [Chloroflexota bacterium]
MPIQPNFLERTAMFNLNLIPGVILEIGGALAFQTVALAAKMGLFKALAARPLTSTEIAQTLNSHPRGTESLLAALASIGYVTEKNGRYANTRMTEKWALDDEVFNLGASMTFWTAVFQELSPDWMQVMQTGDRPYGSIYEWLENKPDIADAFQQQLMANVTFTGADVIKKLRWAETAVKLLDVGGGHGLFSIMLCEQHPHLYATVLDTPTALQTAKSNIAQHGLGERVHLLQGDLWQVEWGDGYDAILLFNLIHHYDAAKNIELLQRCAAALKPGGQIAILDQIAGKLPGNVSNAIIRLIALHYFLLADGRVYTHDDIQSWFQQTGFTEAQFHGIPKAPGTSLMVARKG